MRVRAVGIVVICASSIAVGCFQNDDSGGGDDRVGNGDLTTGDYVISGTETDIDECELGMDELDGVELYVSVEGTEIEISGLFGTIDEGVFDVGGTADLDFTEDDIDCVARIRSTLAGFTTAEDAAHVEYDYFVHRVSGSECDEAIPLYLGYEVPVPCDTRASFEMTKVAIPTPTPQPVLLQADGGAADFSSCTAVSGGSTPVSVKVVAGKQSLDLSATPAPTPGTLIAQFDPLTGTTSGAGSGTTDASGLTNVTVDGNRLVAFKVTHPTDGATTFVDAYDYSHVTPATSDTNGAAVFSLRIVPTSVRNAIAAILGPSVSSLAGLTTFLGEVRDCAGETVVGATLEYAGAEPPRCSSSAPLPCVSYSTNTADDFSDDTGQVFLLGLPGSGQLTVNVMGILVAGDPAVQIGTLTIRGAPDAIVLGDIPAQNAP